MSKQWGILAVFLAVPLLLAQSAGVIEGRVTNSVTGEAVGGVKVRFLDRQSIVHDTVTDSTGAYRLTGLADGNYGGVFTKDGFSEGRLSEPVHVAANVPARADAQIQPWGSLRGRVLDEDGKPAAGVRVECGCTRDDGVATDQSGEFTFQDLRPGSYRLAAKPEAKIRMQDGVRLGTVAIYYPSVTEPAQAVPIVVRIGENVSGIEIRLKSVPVHRVAGVVLGVDGKPAAHATVKLMGRAGAVRQSLGSSVMAVDISLLVYATVGPAPEPEIARTESHDDGAFEFPAVESGDWRLSAEIGVDEDMPLGGVASALVAEKDVEDVQVRLAAPFSVDVMVDWGSAQAPANAGYGWSPVRLTPAEGQPLVFPDPALNVGKINGILPGRYRVMPPIPGLDVYTSAVMWGGRDVNGQVVELTQGASPFQVIYKSGLGKVSGTVENGEGASVFLVSNGFGEIVTFRQAMCGPGGAFEIGQVPPGDYYVVAFERTVGRGLPMTDVVAAVIPIASSVRVESGSTASVDLRVNKWPF